MPAPLAARWLSWSLEPPRAGAPTAARAEIENAGTVAWGADIAASYHWLDERGNAIVWDGVRTALPGVIEPGEHVALELAVRAPMPPGPYRFALDLLAEHRAWFSEIAEAGPEAAVEVAPRIEATCLAEVADVHLPAGAVPSPNWEDRALALHAEGFAVVAGAIDAPRRLRAALAPWAPGPGRVTGFSELLLCPSVLRGIELERLTDVEGLPAFRAPASESWIYDASLAITVP